MNIRLVDGLPFVDVTIFFREKSLHLDNVLLDTGSAGTIFHADRVAEIGVEPEPQDITHLIRGIGGTEFVYSKIIDTVCLDDFLLHSFSVEIGPMDYGYALEGIVGFDLIRLAGLIIDAKNMEIRKKT